MLNTSREFKQNARRALADAGLQKALKFSKPQFMARRSAAVANLPEFEQLRDIGRDIKNHALANLDFYLEVLREPRWRPMAARCIGAARRTRRGRRSWKICRDVGGAGR